MRPTFCLTKWAKDIFICGECDYIGHDHNHIFEHLKGVIDLAWSKK